MAKKIIAMLLVLAMTFTLAACGGTASEGSSAGSQGVSDVIADVSGGKNTAKNKNKNKNKNAKGKKGKSGNNNNNATGGKKAGSAKRVTATQTSTKQNNNTTKKSLTMHAANNVKVKSGASIAQKVNLKGKTITMAITSGEGQYHTGRFNRTIKAFEKKYGCKVKTYNLNFNEYNKQVAQKIAAKASPDIAYCHGSMFPACAVDGLYENLLPSLRSDDLMDNNDPLAGGIDLSKSSYFAFGGKLYGTCNYSSVFPYIFYYNKKMFNDAGLSDPRKLDEKGKWTWSKIESMGRQVTKSSQDLFFLSAATISGRMITLAYGAPIVKAVNGKYKQNVDSKEYIAACQYIWKLGYSAKPIAAAVSEGQHGYDDYDFFLDGGAYMWSQECSKYIELMSEVPSSSALSKSKSNVGIVQVPLATQYNKNRYPTSWLTAVCCGKGRDPKVAIAWDVFRSGYKDPTKDKDSFTDSDQAYVDSLLRGDLSCEPGAFQDSSNQTNVIVANGLQPDVRKAGSPSSIQSIVNKYKNQIQACIDATVKKG